MDGKKDVRRKGRREQDKRQCGKYSSGTAFVEGDDGELIFLLLFQDDGSDQVTADNKENINADIPSTEGLNTRMKEDHG